MLCPKLDKALSEINSRIQACTSCELCDLEFNKKDVTKGFGKLYGWRGGMKKCRFLFLGMNPSHRRFEGHEYAFGGRDGSPGPGKKFNDLLKESGLFEEIFCDNIIHCSSTTNEIKNHWAQACFPHLFDEINALKPEKIIVMGRQVFEMLLKLFEENNIQIPTKLIWGIRVMFFLMVGQRQLNIKKQY